MVPLSVIKEIIAENELYIQNIGEVIQREPHKLPEHLKKLTVFYGVRRSGKTYSLYSLFKTHAGKALYIDFEDDRLENFELSDFNKIKEAFLQLKPNLEGKTLIFFLDEIQNIPGWERYARRVVERDKVQLFISGSSSKINPKELHTILRGRSWGIEVFPFSFREYLSIQGISLKALPEAYINKKAEYSKHFTNYLKWGGFPEVCCEKDERNKRKILKEYLDAIFFKDLVERYKISNIKLLDSLREKLFESSSQRFSLMAFYKQHKANFPFSKDSLFTYYKYFLDSLLVFEVRKFSPSSYKRLRNPAKIYLIDTGIAKKVTSEDQGRMLENVVFLELIRKGFELYYYEDKHECDFIVKTDNNITLPIQVTTELTNINEEREISGLIEACKYIKTNKGLLLTMYEENDITKNGIKIAIRPVWKWLCSLECLL